MPSYIERRREARTDDGNLLALIVRDRNRLFGWSEGTLLSLERSSSRLYESGTDGSPVEICRVKTAGKLSTLPKEVTSAVVYCPEGMPGQITGRPIIDFAGLLFTDTLFIRDAEGRWTREGAIRYISESDVPRLERAVSMGMQVIDPALFFKRRDGLSLPSV